MFYHLSLSSVFIIYSFHGICVILIRSCSTGSQPFDLVPVSESVQIAATAAAGGATGSSSSSTIAEKLGGYSGTSGIPVIELQTVVEQEQKDSSTLTIETNIPPSKPPGWLLKTHMCLRMLINEIQSSDADQLLTSTFPDELACALKSTTLDSPHLSFQQNSEILRRSLTRILLRCSASIFPPVLQLAGSGDLSGVTADLWRKSALEILPLVESSLVVLYELLDCCLPTAPYPVSPAPYLKPSHRFVSSMSRFSSMTGCLWVGGQLIDSALIDALILLITRLSQFWIIFNPQKNSSEFLFDFQKPEWLCSRHDSLLIDGPSSHIIRCLDLTSAAIRLWGARCPDVHPTLLTLAIRHARMSPSAFVTGSIIFSALGGLGAVLPRGECNFLLSSTQPPLVAAELNGAEGRNLEAVVMRLKQQYLQKRQAESVRSGVGAGSGQGIRPGGGKLPTSMTTLTLSARCKLPSSVEASLFGVGIPHFFICQIPLTPTAPPAGGVLPPLVASNVCTSGPAGYSWVRKRLGRLTMADELLSISIFNLDGSGVQTAAAARAGGAAVTTTPLAEPSAVPEWATWERLSELFQTSLEEDAVEAAFGSDRVAAVSLGLSPAAVASIAESRVAAREMMTSLSDESLAEGKLQLQRLEKLGLKFRDMQTEDIAEMFELLVASSFTSNTVLHAASANAVAIATWSHAPPIFDIILHTALTMVKNLSAFLAKELADNRSLGISHLFLLTRLFIFIDNTFALFPTPTLEAAASLIRLAAASLEALQAVPVIDANCPTYPVLRGLFDCLLPAATRLLKSGVTTFYGFIALLNASPVEQLNLGLAVPPPGTGVNGRTGVGSTPQVSAAALLAMKSQAVTPASAMSRNPARFGNVMISSQFRIFLRKPGTPAVPPPAAAQSVTRTAGAPTAATTTSSFPLDLVSGVLSGVRSSCSGVSAILNQLPVAWDVICRTGAGLDPLSSSDTHNDWTGLSLRTVAEILEVLEILTSSHLFCAASLYHIPDSFLVRYVKILVYVRKKILIILQRDSNYYCHWFIV